jgi:hypothetical protein
VALPSLVQHPIKTRFRADIQALISQRRHDLSWRQRGVLRLIAGEQDPLALFFSEAVGHMTAAALAAIHTVPITPKSLPPRFEGAQVSRVNPLAVAQPD